jgi:phosphoribosylformimino-5-aminoimidazole carboxamide ribonucleotide (ProFAR) isomerase
MLIIPAIDIKAGSVVRLTHGDPKQETVYSSDPVEMAKRWVAQGAQRLHVVDLDGAFTGHPANLDLVYRIKDAVNVVVEFGGGLRDPETVKKVLDRGIGRVVGNIVTAGATEILAGAQIHGDIRTSVLSIAEGANFEGNCTMTKEKEVIEADVAAGSLKGRR